MRGLIFGSPLPEKMSQPHDEHKRFFPVGNIFRNILPKRSYLSPNLLALLNSFEQMLSESLRNLKPEEKSDVLTLSWMRRAVESLCEIHSNVKSLITDLQFPVSDWDEKWVDMYLDNSVKLLDICIALSSEIAQLDKGKLLLRYVLHILDFSDGRSPSIDQLKHAVASLSDWMQQKGTKSPKFDDCPVILQSLVGTLCMDKTKHSARGKVLIRVLYGVKVVTVFLCLVITSALSGSSKIMVELKVPDKFIWSPAFAELQSDLIGQVHSEILPIVNETEAIEKCVQKLIILTSSFCHNVETSLQKSNDMSFIGVDVSDNSKKEELQQNNGACSIDMMSYKNNQEGESMQSLAQGFAKDGEQVGVSMQISAQDSTNNTDQDGKNLQNQHKHLVRGAEQAVESLSSSGEYLAKNVEQEGENFRSSVQDLGECLQSSGQVLAKNLGREGENFRSSVQDLSKNVELFSHGLELLSKQVDDFFQIILTGRDALLCNLWVHDETKERKQDENKL